MRQSNRALGSTRRRQNSNSVRHHPHPTSRRRKQRFPPPLTHHASQPQRRHHRPAARLLRRLDRYCYPPRSNPTDPSPKSTSLTHLPDTSHPLSHTRLSAPPSPSFHHLHTPTLSHLLALLLHAPPNRPFPPPTTRLLVLTNPHSLLETSNPRTPAPSTSTNSETYKWAASRRYALLGTLVSALNRLAAANGIAVLVTTGCATRALPGGGPLGLVPGVGGREWEAGIWARGAVGREVGVPGRWVLVEKVAGAARGALVGFAVGVGGVAVAVERDRGETEGKEAVAAAVVTSPVRGRKRAAEEIADSDGEEEEEFGGWAEEVFDAVEEGEGNGTDVSAGGEEGAEEGGKTTIVLD